MNFFIINYWKVFIKYENLCLKDTFEKNLQKKGYGIDIWLSPHLGRQKFSIELEAIIFHVHKKVPHSHGLISLYDAAPLAPLLHAPLVGLGSSEAQALQQLTSLHSSAAKSEIMQFHN